SLLVGSHIRICEPNSLTHKPACRLWPITSSGILLTRLPVIVSLTHGISAVSFVLAVGRQVPGSSSEGTPTISCPTGATKYAYLITQGWTSGSAKRFASTAGS